MQLPLQVNFRNVDTSPALEARIRELAERLQRYCGRITSCRVTVEAPHRHQRQGLLYEVRIDVTVPGREIVVRHTHPRDQAHEDPYVALRDAFRAARRKIEDHERRLQRKVKAHEGPLEGRVSEIHHSEGYGRIETAEGRRVYFHSHSVLGKRFDELEIGDAVRFAEEQGDRGPQASTVHVPA